MLMLAESLGCESLQTWARSGVYRSTGAALSNIIERGSDETGLSIQALPGFVLSASIEGGLEYLSPDILRYTGKLLQDIQSVRREHRRRGSIAPP